MVLILRGEGLPETEFDLYLKEQEEGMQPGEAAFPKERVGGKKREMAQAEGIFSSFKPSGVFYSTHMTLITDYLVFGPLCSCLFSYVGL